MRKPLHWSSREDEIILSNVALIKSKKWKTLSQILKENGFNKKQAECRQRYINFLTLSLGKTLKISFDDLQLFYQKYEEFGPRWTQIQRLLPKMSQAELKNIFYGNIRCIVKKVFKFFTSKTAVFVNKFDTFTLQNIYSGKKNYKSLDFLKEDIKIMRYQFDEKLCFSLIEEKKDKYKRLFHALLDEELTKTSKHYQFFKKVQGQKIGNEVNIFESSQDSEDSDEELKFTDLQVNKVPLGAETNAHLRLQQQSPIKDENLSQLQNSNWNDNENFYTPLNNINGIEYRDVHRPLQVFASQFYFNPGHQLYYEQYVNLQHTMLNPFLPSYQNGYYFIHPGN